MTSPSHAALLALTVGSLAALALSACGDSKTPPARCVSSTDCAASERCIDGMCVAGTPLCRASSAVFLGVGECAETSCTAVLPTDRAIDVHVVADPDTSSEECFEGNNYGLQPNVACDTVI